LKKALLEKFGEDTLWKGLKRKRYGNVKSTLLKTHTATLGGELGEHFVLEPPDHDVLQKHPQLREVRGTFCVHTPPEAEQK
jgi:hypothetical protein